MTTSSQKNASPTIITDEQMVTSSDIRQGYLTGPGIVQLPVEYAVVDGLAIHAGCIELGLVEEVEAEAARIRASHQKPSDQPASGGDDKADGEVAMGIGLPTSSQFLWTNGRVAYTIASDLPNAGRVDDALAHIQARSAIRFVRRTAANAATLPHYIEFIRNPDAGWSSSALGMRGGRQVIRLADGATVGTTVHECLHALGIYHEQSRSDRDNFVEIKWENVNEQFTSNFQKKPGSVDYYDYDYGSIMHYPRTAFSKNGQATIVARQNGVTIGQRSGLSYGDRQTIAKLYERFFANGYTGVWRAERGAYGLWVNASWSSFKSKWEEWAQQGLRLQDIHVRRVGSKTLYSGVWRPGQGGYALWANVSWNSFKAKWEELNQKGLRLVDIHVHRVGNTNRYSGVWLPGSGSYGLWVNASWDSFKAKWEEWAGQGLRLVDIHVHRVGNNTRYSGVWLPGKGGYGLWANASWGSFKAKWEEWAGQGLRLVDINLHQSGGQTRYSGAWLPGRGGYALWANVTWESFRAKWEELAERNYRLVDFEIAMPDSGSADADAATALSLDSDANSLFDEIGEEAFGGLFGLETASAPVEAAEISEPEVGGTVHEVSATLMNAGEGMGGFTVATGGDGELDGEMAEVGGVVFPSATGSHPLANGEAEGSIGGGSLPPMRRAA
ncbi:MAG: M12 family metallopeptidase [Candidatus Binatia bacterium]